MIHAAAAVTFDAPLDGAVEVNLLGPLRVADTLKELARRAGRSSGNEAAAPPPDRRLHRLCEQRTQRRRRRGADHGFEVRLQDRLARRGRAPRGAHVRTRTPSSRSPERLTAFPPRRRAPSSVQRARPSWQRRPSSCAATGSTTAWWSSVAGRSRALGWPDAYAFTKSLGENALLEIRGELPVTFVRPSIVESAFSEPRPGWIRGFGWPSRSSSPTPEAC